MDYNQLSLQLCQTHRGKLQVTPCAPVTNRDELSTAYTPGVAEPCRRIAADVAEAYRYTIKGHTVAVVSDGSAVLGLGNIGPEAAMPVMEGKAVLFKAFGGVDAFPICLATQDVDEIVRTVTLLAPTFGGINLEDISAPRCFEIERRLKEALDIPVFHDDQHGTAIVVLAGLLNALQVVGKTWQDSRIVICGAGSAGISICRLLLQMHPGDVMLVDQKGIVAQGEPWLNPAQAQMATLTNREGRRGTLADAMQGCDVFIGVSAPGIVSEAMVRTMAPGAVVFAMANPVPEIMPQAALAAGAAVVASGRSDFANQINNVLVFPGIFKGALQVQARDISEEMKLAAAQAIAALITPQERRADYIIPSPFDPRVADAVAKAVADVARATGLARC